MHCECLPKDRSQQDETTPPRVTPMGPLALFIPGPRRFPTSLLPAWQGLNHDGAQIATP